MTCLENDSRVGDVLLLHACCHNPCGSDLDIEQWNQLAELSADGGLLPFIDMAYLGFGRGLDEDAAGLRLIAKKVDELLLAVSCSKNFGLYRERTGQFNVVAKDTKGAKVAASQLINIARGIWSIAHSHSAAVVAEILTSLELAEQWEAELANMRNRINHLRSELATKLNAACPSTDFSFIKNEFGMFSFLGIAPSQVARLRDEFSIYMVDSSRINVAGLNGVNIDYFVGAVAECC